MHRTVFLIACLAVIGISLNGCGGGGGGNSPTPAPETPTPKPTTPPPSKPTLPPTPPPPPRPSPGPGPLPSGAQPNPFCKNKSVSNVELQIPQLGKPIGWDNTGTMVGGSNWCKVSTPPAGWHLNKFCAGTEAVQASKGFSVESNELRFLSSSDSGIRRASTETTQIKILTYNLYWWNLFKNQKGLNGMAGKNIAAFAKDVPYDLMGFQECEDVAWPLKDAKAAGMADEFTTHIGDYAIALAYRTAAFEELAQGKADVAEDRLGSQHYGRRGVVWVRLKHKASGKTIFFINHHGPTPVDSGGMCGPDGTAYNLLKVIAENAMVGDVILLAGDFNASWLIEGAGDKKNQFFWQEEIGHLACHFDHMFGNAVNTDMWGIDNFFASCAKYVNGTVMPKGGSDHNALNVIVEI